MILIWIIVGVLLVIGSICDIKSYTLPKWLLLAGLLSSVSGGIFMMRSNAMSGYELAGGLLLGGSCLLISFLTGEQLGYGDGLLLLEVGGCLGGVYTLQICMLGLWFTFAVSVVLLILKKGNKKTRLPFVPFLLIGYLITFGGELFC